MGRVTEYCYPTSIDEALGCLAAWKGEGQVMAGGTDLLPDVRKGKIAPACLVDVTRIPALQRIEVGEREVRVGAAVSFAALREHPFLRENVHALVDAAGSVGAAAIQSAATWVGNIVQGMSAADGAIVAIALDAEAQIVDSEGARSERVEELFAGPGISRIDPCREIVTQIRFPRPRGGTGTAWRRIGRRAALVLPILNCAVRVALEADEAAAGGQGVKLRDAAIALGPVAPRPSRARKAEAFLRGRSVRPEVLERAGEIVRSEASPRTSVMRASREYRLAIIPTLVSDALAAAVERGRAGLGG